MQITRRNFASLAAAPAARFAANDRINVACVGMGRQGMVVMMNLLARPEIQVVAVCDCNEASKDYAEYGDNALLRAARELLKQPDWGADLASPGRVQLAPGFSTSLGAAGREPARRLVDAYSGKGCRAYRDYREMLEKEPGIDAVYVATPDHWHAPITLAAMRKNKHVLCQKPMTHSIGEARRVASLAAETKLATSLPVNNPSSDSTRLIASWIADGAIGRVREVHNWTSRPLWPQGMPRPAESMPVPPGLDWDLWLGPAEARPFHKAYLPFVWRGWLDFGCGSFGDMGCYSFAGIFKILGLRPPLAVEASSSPVSADAYPMSSMVHMDFPGDIRLSWYDGGLTPRQPKGLLPRERALFRHRGEGVLYVGDKGILLAGFNGDNPRIYPESKTYVAPPQPAANRRQTDRDRAVDQWVKACLGGPTPVADFISQGPVTESFLLGCLAQRLPGERLEWDSTAMRVSNHQAANRWVDPPYRES